MGVDSGDQDSGFEAMEDFEFDDSEFVIRIRDVLNSAVKGDMVEYNKLVAVFYRKKYYSPNDVASLVTSLKALSGAVMYIDRLVHESLLEAIFTMSLWDYGPDVMDALMELIISLATLSGKYVDMCLEMIVSNFIPSHTFMPILGQQKGFTRTDEVQSRIHSAMKDIADLAPLSTMRLMSIIIQKKPNFRFQEKLLILYVENMLKMESGELGELARGTMLSGVVDLLLELDVEIGWDHILQPDNTKGVFNMEIADIEDDSDGEFEQNELPTEINRKVLGGNVLAEKLDKLMVLTFEHLQSCKDGGRLVQVFENLLQSYQNTVLTAYKSKFTQFVMFFACTLDPENCGTRFATVLTDIFVSDHCPTLHRMSAAAYLASYLSRGQFLSVSVIWDVLKRLVDWCFSYCTMQTGVIDPKAHRIFYSGCQAIMYVLCFRMRSILTDPWFKQQLFALPFDKILTHQLSPLQVCLPSIVTEFLEQAKAAGLFNSSDKFLFDDYLESESSKAFGGVERLDMFFPFDPCLLKQSERFIRPNYIFWSMVRATYFDEDEDLSDGEADQNGNGDEMNAKSLEENDLDDFDDALNKMSITPRETFLNRHSQMPSKIRPSTSPESL